MFKFLLLALFLAIANATNVQRCRFNGGALPISTRIDGCVNPPCGLPQLAIISINMNLRAPRRLDNLRTLATLYLDLGTSIIPMPYGMGAAGYTCNFFTNVRCPVNNGANVNYSKRVRMESRFMTGLRGFMEYRIVDGAGPLFCINVPVVIVPPRLVAAEEANQEDQEIVKMVAGNDPIEA